MDIDLTADDGCRLWARQTGEGTPLVMCHGGPGMWDYFDDVEVMLGDTARIIRWDQRGCGRSERRGPFTVARFVADLDAVRHAAGADRIALFGHSWGAMLALRYALEFSDRVSALVYVSGTGIDPSEVWRPDYQQNFRRALGVHWQRWEQLRGRDRSPAEERELAVLQWTVDFADPNTAPALAQRLATPWFDINYDCNAAIGADLHHYIDDHDLKAQCRGLRVPTLIVDGAQDVRPRWAVDSLQDALPVVDRVTIAGAGHNPWADDPSAFRDVVTRFLAKNGDRRVDLDGRPLH